MISWDDVYPGAPECSGGGTTGSGSTGGGTTPPAASITLSANTFGPVNSLDSVAFSWSGGSQNYTLTMNNLTFGGGIYSNSAVCSGPATSFNWGACWTPESELSGSDMEFQVTDSAGNYSNKIVISLGAGQEFCENSAIYLAINGQSQIYWGVAGNDSITFSWTASGINPTSYSFVLDGGTNWLPVDGSGQSVTLTPTAYDGGTFYVLVRGCDDSGTCVVSNRVILTERPAGLTFTMTGNNAENTITYAWSGSHIDAFYYMFVAGPSTSLPDPNVDGNWIYLPPNTPNPLTGAANPGVYSARVKGCKTISDFEPECMLSPIRTVNIN